LPLFEIHGEQIGSFHEVWQNEHSFHNFWRKGSALFTKLGELISSFHAVSWVSTDHICKIRSNVQSIQQGGYRWCGVIHEVVCDCEMILDRGSVGREVWIKSRVIIEVPLALVITLIPVLRLVSYHSVTLLWRGNL
jgi:hypothetical protein